MDHTPHHNNRRIYKWSRTGCEEANCRGWSSMERHKKAAVLVPRGVTVWQHTLLCHDRCPASPPVAEEGIFYTVAPWIHEQNAPTSPRPIVIPSPKSLRRRQHRRMTAFQVQKSVRLSLDSGVAVGLGSLACAVRAQPAPRLELPLRLTSLLPSRITLSSISTTWAVLLFPFILHPSPSSQ